jgi:hypothetical protein
VFRVPGFVFRFSFCVFRVLDFVFSFSGLVFRGLYFMLRFSCFGSRFSDFGVRVSDFGLQVSGFEFSVPGFVFRIAFFVFLCFGVTNLSGLLPLGARRVPVPIKGRPPDVIGVSRVHVPDGAQELGGLHAIPAPGSVWVGTVNRIV